MPQLTHCFADAEGRLIAPVRQGLTHGVVDLHMHQIHMISGYDVHAHDGNFMHYPRLLGIFIFIVKKVMIFVNFIALNIFNSSSYLDARGILAGKSK